MDLIYNNPGPAAAIAIILVGLLGVGLPDVLRFSFTRVWAISTVSFRQSIRRRVLWITPLVILGVIIVSQFQKAIDAQDIIRQTTTYCLFATGILVTLVTIMLACTNIPQEIDNRVIYTVATKPTTRLEIVVGKVIGFVRVTFWILLIMGAFTLGYLKFRDWRMTRAIAAQLEMPGAMAEPGRATLAYYRREGTLHARQLGLPRSLAILARMPTGADDFWSPGGAEGEMHVPFVLDRLRIPPIPDLPPGEIEPAGPVFGPSPAGPGGAAAPRGLVIVIQARVQTRLTPEARSASTRPAEPGQEPWRPAPPRLMVGLMNMAGELVVSSRDLGEARGFEIADDGLVTVPVAAEALNKILPLDSKGTPLLVYLQGNDESYDYRATARDVRIIVADTRDVITPTGEVVFAGRWGIYGQQMRGGPASSRLALYQFRNLKLQGGRATYPMEVRLGIERVEDAEATELQLDIHNNKTGRWTRDIRFPVETNRPTYLEIPAEAVEGGDFDVVMRSLTPAWLGLRTGREAALKLVIDDQSFAWNLAKSLGILWMMSLLVTIVAIFSSTFLSWPIAVVLTVVILCGRWGAQQLGDLTQPGIGRQIVTDMRWDSSAAGARAVSEGVDALVKMLNVVAAVLPDISQYSAIQDIERGVAISPREVLWPAARVTFGFGIPLLVLAFVFLKYKEVAP